MAVVPAKRPRRPLYMSTIAASRILGVRPTTIRGWCANHTLEAIRPLRRAPWHERQPVRTVGNYLVSVDSVLALLEHAYSGGVVPRAVARRLRRTGKPDPRGTPQ